MSKVRRSRDPHEKILNIFLALDIDEQASVIRELHAAQMGAERTLAQAGKPAATAQPESRRRVNVPRATAAAPPAAEPAVS